MSNKGLKVKRWTPEEDSVLREVFPRGTREEIRAALSERTIKSIGYRAEHLGVRCEHRPLPSKVLSPVIVRQGIEGKACIRCLEWKPLPKFGKSKSCKGGRNTHCTTCASRNIRERYPETVKRGNAKYQKANPEKLYLNSMRQRARQVGVQVEWITLQNLSDLRTAFGEVCAYCKANKANTFDHVIPLTRGGPHALSNMVPACLRCNQSKKNLTPEEWFASDRQYNPKRA